MESLEERVQNIEERNNRVELDKAWEVSWTRRVFIAVAIHGEFGAAADFAGTLGSRSSFAFSRNTGVSIPFTSSTTFRPPSWYMKSAVNFPTVTPLTTRKNTGWTASALMSLARSSHFNWAYLSASALEAKVWPSSSTLRAPNLLMTLPPCCAKANPAHRRLGRPVAKPERHGGRRGAELDQVPGLQGCLDLAAEL